jgi:hypothetical protein
MDKELTLPLRDPSMKVNLKMAHSTDLADILFLMGPFMRNQ